MNSFLILRWRAYRRVKSDVGARKILGWDIGRVVVWAVFFAFGIALHAEFISASNQGTALRLMIAIVTFGTFLASFVLSVMTATGKRELCHLPDASSVRRMEDRLRWLLSDQLIMVVSTLCAAAAGLTWLCIAASGGYPWKIITASVLAFGGLAVFNALRLPFQIWELQSSALEEERERAYVRLNKANNERFGE